MTEGEFHIDMSNKFKNEINVGIACCNFNGADHRGCALNGKLVQKLHYKFCDSNISHDDNAKLYAATIYCLIKDILSNVRRLVICCDESPRITKKYLLEIIGENTGIEILSIREYREEMGNPIPKIQSLAHGLCNSYRRRALKPWMRSKGTQLNVIEVGFNELKEALSRTAIPTNPQG